MAKISQFSGKNNKVSDNTVTTNLDIKDNDLPIFDKQEVVFIPKTNGMFKEGTNEIYSTSLVIAEKSGFDHKYVILKLIQNSLNNLPSYINKKSFIPGYYRDDDQELKLVYKLKPDALLYICNLVCDVFEKNSL